MEDKEEMDALRLEALEIVRTPKEVVSLLEELGRDLDDREVLYHLYFNPHVSYTDVELWEEDTSTDD